MDKLSAIAGFGPTDAGLRFLNGEPVQAGNPTGFMGIAGAFRTLWRRRWVIAFTTLVVMAGTGIFLARTAPIYTSAATVMVRPTSVAVASPSSAAPLTMANPTEEIAIESKVQLLEAPALARQTAKALDLSDDPEFASPASGSAGLLSRWIRSIFPSPPLRMTPAERVLAIQRARDNAVTSALVNHLEISRIGRSNVISVAASSTDQAKAAKIANRLVNEYIRNSLADAWDDRKQTIADLTDRADHLRTLYQQADAEAATFRRAHGMLNSQPEANASAETMQLAGMRAQTAAEGASDARRVAAARLADGGTAISSPLLVDLRQQEATLTRQLGQLSSFYGPGYADVAKTHAELDALHQRMREETARLSLELGAQSAASRAKDATLAATLAGIKSRSLADGTAAVPLRVMERRADALNTQYLALLNQLNMAVGSAQTSQADIIRVSPAVASDGPSFPIPKRVLAIAFLASIMLGTVLAFVIEAMDTKLRTGEQVRRLLGLPTLAMIPEVPAYLGEAHAQIATRPQSRFAEAMRNLLIEVEARTAGKETRVVLVTSPLEGEGKNTVAQSLAAAATVIGRRAVVVDLDMRRLESSSLSKRLSGHDRGVSGFLTDGSSRVEELLEPAAAPNDPFATIGVGPHVRDPGLLITSPRLAELVTGLRDRFDMIILNAPPVLPVRDAKSLVAYADATLLVLRWGRTSPEAAAVAMEMFGGEITGAVINRVNYRVHADQRYGDAIHYVAKSSAYFDHDPPGKWWMAFARSKTRVRQVAGHVAERFHLA